MVKYRKNFSNLWRYRFFYAILAPGIVFFIIFHYIPIYGAKLAFYDYRIIGPDIWVGLKHFRILFSSPAFKQVFLNTIIISAMKMGFFFPVPIILSLLVNEIRSTGFRKYVQSVIYLPHFLSWVIIAGIFISILSPSVGIVNSFIRLLGGEAKNFMTETGYIRWILVISEIWRSGGWDSLLYFAAIMQIEPSLYEAARLDGANRLQQTFHITLPQISGTILTVFILNLGFFMNAGFDQVFNFANDAVINKIDIIDTYVYRIGLMQGAFSTATAAGLFKGGIGLFLILGAHLFAKRISGRGLWQ